MQMIHGTRSEEYPPENARTDNPQEEFKICPICGATCFADMEICFGCLHRFSDDEPRKAPAQAMPSSPSQETASPLPYPEQAPSQSFDHTHDIASLQKPAEETLVVAPDPQTLIKTKDGLTSHHVCSDKDGHQFEIAISIKML